VVLLGQVGELEVEGEGAEDVSLPLEWEGRHRPREPRARRLTAGRPCLAREIADPLLVGEEPGAALFDEHPAEDVPEQADFPPPEGCVRTGRAQGLVTAPSLADETSAAYLANTPVS
jgi:hypothetical protein